MKYFKITPKSDIAAIIAVSNEDDVMPHFALKMDSDMNHYFEAVEISKETFDKLEKQGTEKHFRFR